MLSSVDKYIKENALKKLEVTFNTRSLLKEVDYVFKSSHLSKRNLFFFRNGSSAPYESPPSFDLNFVSNVLYSDKTKSLLEEHSHGMLIRGLQSSSKFFYKHSLSQFRKTFCLNNNNLYLNLKVSKSFKEHSDPHSAFIYFISGEKRWRLYQDEIETNPGDILFIPSDCKHDVESVADNSLHITSSYYSFPLSWKSKVVKLNLPKESDLKYSDELYIQMKKFFRRNFEDRINAYLFGQDIDYLKTHYMFYHKTKNLLFISGVGEVQFSKRDDLMLAWQYLDPMNDNANEDLKIELHERITKAKS